MAGACDIEVEANESNELRGSEPTRRARSRRVTMSTKIIVSYDGTANEDDAIALGRVFASAGAEVALAYVRHSQEPDLDREKLAQSEAEELLSRGAQLFGNADIAKHVVTDRSTPQGLSALAA